MHQYFAQKPIVINAMKFLEYDEMLTLQQLLPANSQSANNIKSYIALHQIHTKKLFSTYLSDQQLYSFDDAHVSLTARVLNTQNQSMQLLDLWDYNTKLWNTQKENSCQEFAYLVDTLKGIHINRALPISNSNFKNRVQL